MGLRGPKPKFPDDGEIIVLAAGNPKKKGSAAHARFALYVTGMTVGEARSAGVRLDDLTWDHRHRHIRISAASA